MTQNNDVHLCVESSVTSFTKDQGQLYKNIIISLSFKPNSLLNSIDAGSFSNCQKLLKVDLSNCLYLITLEEDVFWNCNSLREVILPPKLNTIKGGCFSYTNITQITFPSSLQYILRHKTKNNTGPFSRSSLSSINYSASNNLVTIEDYAFAFCYLETFEIGPQLVTITGVSFENHAKCFRSFTTTKEKNPYYTVENGILYKENDLIYCPPAIENPLLKEGITILQTECFMGNTMVDCTFLRDSITTIRGYVFYRCYNLKRVYLPSSVNILESRCFSFCNSLVTVVFPSNISVIPSYTLYQCSSIKIITIPEGVKSIESLAFSGCISLSYIIIPNSVKTIAKDSFVGSGVEKCGITCSDTEKEVIRQVLPEHVFNICVESNHQYSCKKGKYLSSIFVYLLFLRSSM